MALIKFPSLASLWQGAINTAQRFPLPLLCAIINFSIAVYLVDLSYDTKKNVEHLYKIMMCCWLGLNLFLAIIFYSESKKISRFKSLLYQLIGAVLLVLYYFSLPEIKEFNQIDIARYILFIIGMHLLVSFSPFIARGHINGFWQFNKTLFLRFLTSALYTGVLHIGLCIALLAIDNLFNVKIEDETYFRLWFFLSMVFNTWFFLSGIPSNLQQLDYSDAYPKGLKIFTQFVLLPLVAVYLLILYAYTLKILIQWNMPSGWVAYLVIGFSTAGILSLLLIYPIRNLEGNTWIRIFSKWFYRALYPLIVLLFVAIFERLNQYGITENRYFVLLLAFWLAAIVSYFLLSKKENIKVIPISLCLIAFLSSFGPWGAFSVSERSQVNRLENLLEKNKILVEGKIKKSESEVSSEDADQINSIVKYLDKAHGYHEIKPWFTQNLDSAFTSADSNIYVNKSAIVLKLMGLKSTGYDSMDGEDRLYFYSDWNDSYKISGYDYHTSFNSYDNNAKLDIENDSLKLSYLAGSNIYIFKKEEKIILAASFNDFFKNLKKVEREKDSGNDKISKEKMTFEIENNSLKVKFMFNNISGEIKNDRVNIISMQGSLLLKIK